MIVDIPRFVAAEQPYWDELHAVLDRMDAEPERRLPVVDPRRIKTQVTSEYLEVKRRQVL